MVMHIYIRASFLYNIKQKDNVFYHDASILIHTLIIVLYLENEPFLDSKMMHRWIEIKMENEERSYAQIQAVCQCWSESADKTKQCENVDEIEQIIRQRDEEEERILGGYPLLDYPVSLPPEEKKNILLTIFIHITTFSLCLLGVWNYLLLFSRGSIASFIRINTTRILERNFLLSL